MEHIDGFLTGKARQIYGEGATVVKIELDGTDDRGRPKELWVVRVPNEPDVGIGGWFAAAKDTLNKLLRTAKRNKQVKVAYGK